VALLISSAGLAASLLAGAAVSHVGTQNVSWQPTARLAQPTSELSINKQLGEPALPASLNSLVPAYSAAASTTGGTPLASSASDQLPEQAATTNPTRLPLASSLKSTVQRSWHTFKLAFR